MDYSQIMIKILVVTVLGTLGYIRYYMYVLPNLAEPTKIVNLSVETKLRNRTLTNELHRRLRLHEWIIDIKTK